MSESLVELVLSDVVFSSPSIISGLFDTSILLCVKREVFESITKGKFSSIGDYV